MDNSPTRHEVQTAGWQMPMRMFRNVDLKGTMASLGIMIDVERKE